MSDLRRRFRIAALVGLDAAGYVLVVTALATLAALTLGIVTGGGLVRAKSLLFLIGFGVMAYATVRLWPSSPSELENETMEGVQQANGGSIPASYNETRLQEVVRRIPPFRWIRRPPPQHRLSPAGKLFWSSLAVLAVSYFMETALGIA